MHVLCRQSQRLSQVLPVFFPQQAKYNDEAGFVAIVVATLIMLVVCCLQFWVGMGEELGWMGYLFPRLEQLCGTSVALILMGSVLVWATKASKSVLPASLIHVMTNALPGVIVGVICYIVLLNKYRVEK